jgi:hypothetical protein
MIHGTSFCGLIRAKIKLLRVYTVFTDDYIGNQGSLEYLRSFYFCCTNFGGKCILAISIFIKVSGFTYVPVWRRYVCHAGRHFSID